MDKKNLWQKIQQAYQNQDWSSAKDDLKQLIEDDPKDISALNAYAAVLTQLSEYEQALSLLNAAIDYQPDAIALYNSRGNVQLRLNHHKQAIDNFKQALLIDADYVPALSNLARCYLRDDQAKKAIEHYRKVVLIDDKQPAHWLQLAVAHLKNNDSDEAEQALKKCLQVDPKYLPAWRQMAEIYLDQKQYEKAGLLYAQVLSSEPNDADALIGVANCEIEQRETDAAIDHLNTLLNLIPDHPDAHYLLATAYLKAGNMKQALAHYQKQLEKQPTQESYYNIGVLMMYQNRFQEAIHYLLESLTYDPDYFDAHMNLASIYLKKQDFTQARNHYYKAEALQPNNLEIKHILAAITQNKCPNEAPREYVEHLFDQYAPYYDEHLTKQLECHVADLILNTLLDHTNMVDESWQIFDLGCGSGLCAQALTDYATAIDGVDLSASMLEYARAKNIYRHLKHEDIITALDTADIKYDCLIAGDVLPYIGKLNTLFKVAHQALTKKGYFIFSVERSNDEDYLLQKSIRYAHHRRYIEKIAKQYHWTLVDVSEQILRKQMNKPIHGYVVLMQSNN